VIRCCLAQGHGERSFRNSEKRLRSREVVVSMRIISLHFWIGEKMKKARTMVLMALWNPKEYSPPLAIPAYKISHLGTFDHVGGGEMFLSARANKDLSVFTHCMVLLALSHHYIAG
jgi:hypothetical protein